MGDNEKKQTVQEHAQELMENIKSNREEEDPTSANVEVKSSPVKRFFVEMLTKDINLEDAIMDLVDNSIEGMMRQELIKGKIPDDGFFISISFDKDYFKIEDNCGGIERKIAQDYAFRMGRVKDRNFEDIYGLGMFGIGMKRAMFKIGEDSEVISQYGDEKPYTVVINKEWMGRDEYWDLIMETKYPSPSLKSGTRIHIKSLKKGVSDLFSDEAFKNELYNSLSIIYDGFIREGLKIIVNKVKIGSKPIEILFPKEKPEKTNVKNLIFPYVYKEELNGVKTTIVIGIKGEIPDNVAREEDMEKRTRDVYNPSGWTIMCNGRIVLFADRSRITGWGNGVVPNFHYQFNYIVGLVVFESKDPLKLPLTTTKRGIDVSSDFYLRIRNRMDEGMRIWTSYTNKWKNLKNEEKENLKNCDLISRDILDIRKLMNEDAYYKNLFKKVRDGKEGLVIKPELPKPAETNQPDAKTIRFVKKNKEIRLVSLYVFNGIEKNANEVGEKCFDIILKQSTGDREGS